MVARSILIFLLMIGGVLFTPEVQAYDFKTCVVEENAITEVKDYSKVANEEVCTYHYYQGELNGIEDVRLAFAKRSGVVIGELWYDETSYSTPVIGFSSQDNENEITFYVSDGITFSSIGMVLTGEMNGNQLVCFDERIQKESKLKKYKGDIRYAMDRESDAYCSPFKKDYVYPFDSRNRAGIYEISLPNGATGHIDISLFGEDWEDVNFNLECYSGGVRNYQVLCEGESRLEGASFIYTFECGYQISVTFYNGFIILRKVGGDKKNCFESNSVSIEGLYIEMPSVG